MEQHDRSSPKHAEPLYPLASSSRRSSPFSARLLLGNNWRTLHELRHPLSLTAISLVIDETSESTRRPKTLLRTTSSHKRKSAT